MPLSSCSLTASQIAAYRSLRFGTSLSGFHERVQASRPNLSRGQLKCAAQADFDSMAADRGRRYFMVGGKGGVGKTSLAASLAVKFANSGHATLVVSTDPAHSLSDSLDQDVTGGTPVFVEGTEMPLCALEIDPEKARDELRTFASGDGGKEVQDFMGSVGLGGMYEQLADLKLSELLDTPPPGLDEALAIAKVVQFTKNEEFAQYTRIVFDTAPTGHTLRLLSLPDFLEASIGKVVRLRQKLTSATSAIKGLFGAEEEQDEAIDKLEKLKAEMQEVRDLFRDPSQTEFIIATIPTIMAISESGRLLTELRAEEVPVKRIVMNQLMPPVDETAVATPDEVKTMLQSLDKEYGTHLTAYNRFCEVKRKDQQRAMALLEGDPGLSQLVQIKGPLFDMEIRGVPALQFFGMQVWT